MNNANMLRNIKWYFYSKCQQSGAEEACWAHNPEVVGSKPTDAYGGANPKTFTPSAIV